MSSESVALDGAAPNNSNAKGGDADGDAESDKRVGPSSFERLKLIGRGDVGRVYLVRHKASGALYAMKVLTKQEMMRRNKIKRVLTEREILATSDHPFIVTLQWSFQSKDSLFFIMEYCAGGEFFRTLQKQPGKRLSEEHVRFYAAEVLLALEYLHMMGFIYRDLKPENILLHATGHIMLTDFDLSKQATAPVQAKMIKGMFDQASDAKLELVPELVTNSFVGTEEYIAPEVIDGFGHTSSVDWWTFGVLIYEMLFGKTPFKGKSRDETFKQIVKAGLKFPDGISISRECRSLMKKLICADPKKRLGSQHGAADIKAHPWFAQIKWPLLRNDKPPIIPKITHDLDTRNFRALKDDTLVKMDAEIDSTSLPESDPWRDFHRVDKDRDKEKKKKKKKTKKKDKDEADSDGGKRKKDRDEAEGDSGKRKKEKEESENKEK